MGARDRHALHCGCSLVSDPREKQLNSDTEEARPKVQERKETTMSEWPLPTPYSSLIVKFVFGRQQIEALGFFL